MSDCEVALAVEQRGVAALLRLERLDVVGELALQVLGGVGPADEQHRPVPDDESGLLAEGPVLPVELDLGRGLGHAPIVGRGLAGSLATGLS